MNIIPEKSTAQNSGDQVTSTEVTETTSATEQPPVTEQQPISYKEKIDELTRIAQTGSYEEQLQAEKDLSDIERQLLEAEKEPEATVVTETKTDTDNPTGDSVGDTEPNKKFAVYYNGQRHEIDDDNGLLGYKGTGAVKAALIKTELMLKDRKKREAELAQELREAKDKFEQLSKASPQQVTQEPQQPPVTPQQPKPVVERPVPPVLPALSTKDPSLYTEDDIEKVSAYNAAVADFSIKSLEYTDYRSSLTQSVDPAIQKRLDELDARVKKADEVIGTVEEEKKTLAEQKAENDHWQRFTDFQNTHTSFATPLPPKKMNDAMSEWMSKVAAANGVPDQNKWSLADRYLAGDPTVTKNSEGLKPPEGHDAFFKLLDVFNAYKTLTAEGGPLTEGVATLDDAYLIHKSRSGEIDAELEALRTTERTNAVEEFSTHAQQLQQSAVNIDPSQSSGGPDLNAIGISAEDFQWFSRTPIDSLQMDSVAYKKWDAIGKKIVKYAA